MGSGFNFFTNGIDVSPTTTGAWVDVDCSAHIPAGSTGVILKIVNNTTTGRAEVRKNGSSDDFGLNLPANYFRFAFIGVDENRVFEGLRNNTAVHIMLIGYTKNPVTFFTDPVDKSLSQTSQWIDIDVTGDTDPTADGAILFMRNSSSSTNPYGDIRKNGSSDDHTAKGRFTWDECRGVAVGLDSENIFEGWIDNTVLDFYLIGYCKPAAITKTWSCHTKNDSCFKSSTPRDEVGSKSKRSPCL